MTQPDFRTMAQQGKPSAIALWLNHILQPHGVTAKILLKTGVLKILLLADSPPRSPANPQPHNQQAILQLLQDQIRTLNLPDLDRIRVYYQPAEGQPLWIAEFSLPPIIHQTIANKTIANKTIANKAIAKNNALDPISFRQADLEPELNQANPDETSRSNRRNSRFLPLLSLIFPVWQFLRPQLYRRTIVQLLLFLGLLPLVINLLAEQVTLAQTAWLTGLYYAIVWGLLLYVLIKPSQVSWYKAIGCVLFTAFVSVPLLLLAQRIPPFSALYQATGQPLPYRLIGFVLGVGVLEEICKVIPVLLLMLHRRHPINLHTLTFYAAVSGLGFAVAESGAYSVQYAIGLTRGQIDLGVYLAANTIRFVSLPLFHAVLAGMMGYFIGLAGRYASRRIALLLTGLTIAAVLHGLYNAFSGGLSGLCVIGFSILLFVSYLDRSPNILQSLEQIEQAKSHTKL